MVEKWQKAPDWSEISPKDKKQMLAAANERSVSAFAAVDPESWRATATGMLGSAQESKVAEVGDAGNSDDVKSVYFVPAHV